MQRGFIVCQRGLCQQEILTDKTMLRIIMELGGMGHCISMAGWFQISDTLFQVGRGCPSLGVSIITSVIVVLVKLSFLGICVE